MVHVLLCLVRVVPHQLALELSAALVEAPDLDPHDALERVQHGAGAQAVGGRRPGRTLAQVHRVVVAVGEPEAQQQAPRHVDAERVDQLLAQQAHRRRAQDHDALVVQPDHPEIGAEVEQLGQLHPIEGDGAAHGPDGNRARGRSRPRQHRQSQPPRRQ